MLPHWYKNAIIYGLQVDTFQDSNGDGMGIAVLSDVGTRQWL